MLRQLGIEKGKPFAPDERLRRILTEASTAGELMAKASSFAKRFPDVRYWPDRQRDLVAVLDHSSQRAEGYDQLLEHSAWFYEAVSFSEAMHSRTPGEGRAYLGSYTDADGQWLDGARPYTPHVPADPPAKLFWSVTVYDTESRCLIDNPQGRGDRGSRDADLRYNADGSVDLHFGPVPPPGRKSNWVQTLPGRHWFSYLRFYGPLAPYSDRSRKLGDIQLGRPDRCCLPHRRADPHQTERTTMALPDAETARATAAHGDDYLTRAVGVDKGLYGLPSDEAWYAGRLTDDQGNRPPDAAKRDYVIHFPPGRLPPARFFWSATMYRLPERLLADNPADRYSIGDRTPGLVHDEDDGLTLYVQQARPQDPDKAANWLPAPTGPFTVAIRIHGPDPAVLDGSWSMPDLTVNNGG